MSGGREPTTGISTVRIPPPCGRDTADAVFQAVERPIHEEHYGSGPGKSHSALQSKFKLLVEELSDPESLSVAVARFTLRRGSQPTCWPINPVSQAAVPARPRPSSPIPVDSVCPFFFAGQLKVDDIKTGHRFKCSRPNYVRIHKKVHGLSRQEMLTIVDTFPP